MAFLGVGSQTCLVLQLQYVKFTIGGSFGYCNIHFPRYANVLQVVWGGMPVETGMIEGKRTKYIVCVLCTCTHTKEVGNERCILGVFPFENDRMIDGLDATVRTLVAWFSPWFQHCTLPPGFHVDFAWDRRGFRIGIGQCEFTTPQTWYFRDINRELPIIQGGLESTNRNFLCESLRVNPKSRQSPNIVTTVTNSINPAPAGFPS
jgi:hypothetical protein